MISQKESSINNKTVGFDEYDPQIYAKVQEIQRQYRVARENEWYARQERMASQMANIPSSMNELVSHVRRLEQEVGYLTTEIGRLRNIISTKSLLLDESIDEIYGDKI